ncbi:unnamed protein product [Lactuca virosa]|uniref:Coilin N-terminal domain-containing protein n=1 Tax=Lactuca virosa TaxID=75947 RepID=A0AAU9N794_9ASTR|nr:unnamed protein product [Lactuca virosa]
METQSIRLRLVFEDGSLLSETQRSDGMNQSWLLDEPNQHQKISDVCNHLLHSFNLRDSCPNGILLYMDGFVLPPSESTRILKDREFLCVKRKGMAMAMAEAIEEADACNLVKEEKKLEHESSSVETVSKKRKLQASNLSLKQLKEMFKAVTSEAMNAKNNQEARSALQTLCEPIGGW